MIDMVEIVTVFAKKQFGTGVYFRLTVDLSICLFLSFLLTYEIVSVPLPYPPC